MKFPEKYIKRGKFKLHSGGTTNIFYDVNSYMTMNIEKIKREVPWLYDIHIGIATGGAIIASQFSKWGMVKDGEYKGTEIGNKSYCLVDDVCTTEGSLREAMKILYNICGRYPDEIFVVVDRRKGIKKLCIESMFGLE